MHWSEVHNSSTDQETVLMTCYFLRFSEIEQIAVLSVTILHYRITILEESQYAHETIEERKMQVLASKTRFVVKPRTPREGANIPAR